MGALLGFNSDNHRFRTSLEHTGVFALKIISNNAVLLVIIISTTFAPLGSRRLSNEKKNYRELESLGLGRCF